LYTRSSRLSALRSSFSLIARRSRCDASRRGGRRDRAIERARVCARRARDRGQRDRASDAFSARSVVVCANSETRRRRVTVAANSVYIPSL
jgi:hypothetical protein